MTAAVNSLHTDECRTSFAFFDTRTIIQAIQALKFSSKQILRVTLTSDGASFRSEDDGKVCQSSAFFPANFFSSYDIAAHRRAFCVQLSVLLDTLKVFAALPDVCVCVTHSADRLVLETTEDEGGTTTCMYAHLAILGPSQFHDVLDNWQLPAAEFLTDASILREAVEDLEWPQGPVRVSIKSRPFQVSLNAEGNVGQLGVVLPSNQLRQQIAPRTTVSFQYAYKFMKIALVGAASIKGDSSSRLAMDANGLLKVVHILGSGHDGAHPLAPSAQSSQVMSAAVVVTYTVQPMFEEVEQAEAEDNTI